MAKTYTENYNLEKDDRNEFYDVEVQSRNMDKVDDELKKVNDKADEKAAKTYVDQELGKKVNKSGDVMTGALSVVRPTTIPNSVKDYKNVLHFYDQSDIVTGILKIVMPKGWSASQIKITLKGYTYDLGGFSLEFGGYNLGSGTGWGFPYAILNGKAPFTKVRLGYDGTNVVVLIGDTSTQWDRLKFSIDAFITRTQVNGWEDGWSAEYVADTTGITNINEPSLQYGNILERGSNANGEFIRFSDGTQICWHSISVNTLGTGSGTWTFPSSFISSPNVDINFSPITSTSSTFDSSNNIVRQGVFPIRRSERTPTSAPYIFHTTTSSNQGIEFFAIGRWR